MTNAQIIQTTQKLNGIEETCHTYAHWKSLGYQVKKGSKALFKARIWKYAAKKKAEDSDEENGRMFMKTASFFGFLQVEKVAA